MNNFLGKFWLSKLIEAENLNRPIFLEVIEKLIKELFLKKKKTKFQAPIFFTGEFYQTSIYQIVPKLYKLSQSIKNKEKLPISSYEAKIILVPQSNTVQKRKLMKTYEVPHI